MSQLLLEHLVTPIQSAADDILICSGRTWNEFYQEMIVHNTLQVLLLTNWDPKAATMTENPHNVPNNDSIHLKITGDIASSESPETQYPVQVVFSNWYRWAYPTNSI